MNDEKVLRYINSQILKIKAEIADFFAENLGKNAESELDFANKVFSTCEQNLVNDNDEGSFSQVYFALQKIFTDKKIFEKADKMYANLASKVIDKFVLTSSKSNEHEISLVLKKYQNMEEFCEDKQSL